MPSLADRLRRRTTSGAYLPEIDGLRFVCIALVVLYHIGAQLEVKRPDVAEFAKVSVVYHAISLGHYGVELFFVISGFVLALPFASQHLRGGRPVKLRQYFSRRITRLEPPYIVAMVGCGLALAATGASTVRDILPHLLASIAYVHNFIFRRSSTIDTVAWSLEIEVQFYMLAPLLGAVFCVKSRLPRRVLLALLMTSFAAAVPVWRGTVWNLSVLPYAQFFLSGMLLADIYIVDWDTAPTAHGMYDLVTVLGWPSLFTMWYFFPHFYVVFPFAVLAVFVAAFRGRAARRVFRMSILCTIGGMCYSIYLLHFPLIGFLTRFTLALGQNAGAGTQLLVQALLLSPAVILVSAVYYLLLERPCMDRDWPRKLIRALDWRSLSTPQAPSIVDV